MEAFFLMPTCFDLGMAKVALEGKHGSLRTKVNGEVKEGIGCSLGVLSQPMTHLWNRAGTYRWSSRNRADIFRIATGLCLHAGQLGHHQSKSVWIEEALHPPTHG